MRIVILKLSFLVEFIFFKYKAIASKIHEKILSLDILSYEKLYLLIWLIATEDKIKTRSIFPSFCFEMSGNRHQNLQELSNQHYDCSDKNNYTTSYILCIYYILIYIYFLPLFTLISTNSVSIIFVIRPLFFVIILNLFGSIFFQMSFFMTQ